MRQMLLIITDVTSIAMNDADYSAQQPRILPGIKQGVLNQEV